MLQCTIFATSICFLNFIKRQFEDQVMKMNSELDMKIDAKSQASLNRHPEVLASSSLQNFSSRLKHLKLWINARLDAHHERTLSLRVHRQNRID